MADDHDEELCLWSDVQDGGYKSEQGVTLKGTGGSVDCGCGCTRCNTPGDAPFEIQ
jgi:hypothetical protein